MRREKDEETVRRKGFITGAEDGSEDGGDNAGQADAGTDFQDCGVLRKVVSGVQEPVGQKEGSSPNLEAHEV